MKIHSGLFNSGVLQRTAADVSDTPIAGSCRTSGTVMARVMREGKVVPGFNGLLVGNAAKGKFTAQLAGLPVGGPYTVELAAGSEKITVNDVLVGDVWIIGGQSNAQGCGLVSESAKPHPLVRAWYMDDRWAVGQDPIHNMWATVDQVHIDLCGARPPKQVMRGAGPGVAFGAEMQRLTGVPQGVIAAAHGGTSMAQWDPKLKGLGSRSLYGAMLRRVKKLGGQVAGLVWYQGCSDAGSEAAQVYTVAMQKLVRTLRKDLKAPTLPVAIVQIGAVYGNDPALFTNWNDIQEQQRKLPAKIANLAVVPAIDLSLDDLIHISGRDQIRLGKRLATAMHGLATAGSAPAITLKSIKMKRSHWEGMDLILTFDHVVGSLQAAGRPWGFALLYNDRDNNIYDVRLDGNRAIVRTTLYATEIDTAILYYGHGPGPYCNITDAADRGIPMFGAVPVGNPRALTSFVHPPHVSVPMPLQGTVQTLAFPVKLDLQPREFIGAFCDVHLDEGRTSDPQVQYFSCRLSCPEPMPLQMLLGYDGPIKAWLDGNEVFCDPNGTNPGYVDETKTLLTLTAGKHELLIALGLNHNKAWGIYLRFERKDIPKQLLKKGEYVLPEIGG